MRIKHFRGSSLAGALAGVKAELGPDAVLISSRTLGPQEAGPGEKVEVTVAVDGDGVEDLGGRADRRGRLTLERIQDDLAHIRALLAVSAAKKTIPHLIGPNPNLRLFFEKLVNAGVEETLALRLLEKLLDGLGGGVDSADAKTIRRELSRVLRESIFIAGPPLTGPIRWALIGPTGGGKTTTLAKLAALFSRREGKTVGLISVDNYRLGATEQLGAFARLLDLELVVAYNREEMRAALDEFSDKDVVLVDTAGRNHRNLLNMNELKLLLKEIPGLQRWLVLPATTKDRDLSAAAESFMEIGLAGLMFTKLDETDGYGGIINQVLRYHLPVAYLTAGQRVPEDIEAATHERVLKLVLNGSSY